MNEILHNDAQDQTAERVEHRGQQHPDQLHPERIPEGLIPEQLDIVRKGDEVLLAQTGPVRHGDLDVQDPLHGSGGHALDEVFLQREIQQHDWADGNGQRSKLHAVVLRFSGKQVVDHRLQAPQLLAFQECHGEQELIPREHGLENCDGRHDRLGQRQERNAAWTLHRPRETTPRD